LASVCYITVERNPFSSVLVVHCSYMVAVQQIYYSKNGAAILAVRLGLGDSRRFGDNE
jgi:hypothetical protein